ncbi:MAG: hypothetical protein C4523_10770 [Myxococcales bacterium]|nr:MAG: hypothetical protein C4523_10770 [Myxococcales bacterium]
MQQLGSSIASLGDAFGDMGNSKEQDFNDKMTMLRTDTDIDLANIEAQNTYQGTGDDYLTQRSDFYDQRTSEALGSISAKNQNQAKLFFEQRRGPKLESAARFGGKVRQDTLISSIDETVATEFGKVATVPPEELDQTLQTTLEGVNAIIKTAPLPDTLKDELSARAAGRAIDVMTSVRDPDLVQEMVPRAMRFIDQLEEVPQQEILPPEPQGAIQPQQGILPNAQQGQIPRQGLPGTPSGQGLSGGANPQRRSDINFRDFSNGRSGRPLASNQVRYIILHDVSGNPKTRALPAPGNIPNYHITFDDKGVYQEMPLNVQAPHARAFNKHAIGIAYRGFEGDKLSPQAIANGAAAVKAVAQQFGITPERILTHPGAGRSATRSGKNPLEAAWRKEVLAYLENEPQNRNVAQVEDITGEDIPRPGQAPQRKPGTIPQSAIAQQQATQGLKAVATAYSPQKGGDAMEGGYAAARKGPDGKAEVRTLVDVAAKRSEYVTLAGDKSEFGKTYIIPEITFKDASGKTITLTNVKGVVHDTGSAFKGKGSGRVDIAVDHDLPQGAINTQPFSKQEIALLPVDAGKETPLAQRGLTTYAGLGGPQGENAQAVGQEGGPQESVGPDAPYQVADASGKFPVPALRRGWRPVQSHLREKLIDKLPQLRSMALTAERQREQMEERAFKEESAYARLEGIKHKMDGTLTLEWIEQNEARLGPQNTEALLKAYKSDSVLPLEPEEHLSLLKLVDEKPQEGLEQATEYFLGNRISRSQFDEIRRSVQKELNPETRTPQWAKDWVGEVREQVATHQGDSWDRIERSQRVMKEFRDYVDQESQKGSLEYAKVSKRAKEMIDDYKLRKSRDRRSSLPLPERWSKATNETMSFDELTAAEQRLATEFQKEATGVLDDPVAYQSLRSKYAEDAKTLKRWRKVLEEEAAAKGEKIPPQTPPQVQQPAQGKGAKQSGDGLVEEPAEGDRPPGMMRLGGPKDQDSAGQPRPVGPYPYLSQMMQRGYGHEMRGDVPQERASMLPIGSWGDGPAFAMPGAVVDAREALGRFGRSVEQATGQAQYTPEETFPRPEDVVLPGLAVAGTGAMRAPVAGAARTVSGKAPAHVEASRPLTSSPVALEGISADAPHPGPVSAYHGTDRSFRRFDINRSADIGTHFGTEQQALTRANQVARSSEASGEPARTIPVTLDVNKVVTLPDMRWSWPDEIARHLEATEPALSGITDQITPLLGDKPRAFKAIRDRLIDAGYDGIRYRNFGTEGDGWSYIAIKPGTVKSSTTGETLFSNPKEAAPAGMLLALPEDHPLRQFAERRFELRKKDALWDEKQNKVTDAIESVLSYRSDLTPTQLMQATEDLAKGKEPSIDGQAANLLRHYKAPEAFAEFDKFAREHSKLAEDTRANWTIDNDEQLAANPKEGAAAGGVTAASGDKQEHHSQVQPRDEEGKFVAEDEVPNAKTKLRDKGYTDKVAPPVSEQETWTPEMLDEYARIWFGKEDELIAQGVPKDKAREMAREHPDVKAARERLLKNGPKQPPGDMQPLIAR